MFFVSLFYFVLTTGKKSKVEDYSRLQESSSAKSTGMFKKSKFTRKMNISFMIVISAENGLAAPDSANTQLGSSSNFKDPTKIEYVLDWPSVVKKYYNVIKNVPTES